MRNLRGHITYANVVATLALVLVVAGGTAYAANTIGSSDIIDESILSEDVKNGEVKTADVGNSQIHSVDIRNDTLTGGDIADDALTGADVSESTLATVPNATTVDGLDSSRLTNVAKTGTGQCLNQTSTDTTCASAAISGLSGGDDVYVSAWWRWYGTGVGQDAGFCAIKRGSAQLEGSFYGQNGNEHVTNDTGASATLVGLETTAPAGTASFSLICHEVDGAMNIVGARIVAVRLTG
jgi:hypothetical protein